MSYTNNNSWWNTYYQPQQTPAVQPDWYSNQLKAYQERQAQQAQQAQQAEAAKQTKHADLIKMWQEKIQQPVTQYGYDSNWNAFPLPSSNLYSGYHQWWG